MFWIPIGMIYMKNYPIRDCHVAQDAPRNDRAGKKLKSPLPPLLKGETIPGKAFSSSSGAAKQHEGLSWKYTGMINQAPTKEYKMEGRNVLRPIFL